MYFKTVVLFIITLAASNLSFAQIRKVPVEVTAAFSKQYPHAGDVTYKDNLKAFHVHFTLDGEQMIAKYNAKGAWKETEKTIDVALVPQSVNAGFEKSKYWDWKTVGAVLIQHPSGTVQYRLKVEKNEVQKKYLFYNKSGRLIRDAITI